MATGKVLAVIGAQYGSEGKGVIVNHIANRYDVHVRVGAPNAGHTFYHEGRKFVMQSVPCGWTNPNATLYLGRGALINPIILCGEIIMLKEAGIDIRPQLKIDAMAGILDPKFHEEEGGINGEMHQRIGSTGEGVGLARIARIQRDPSQFKHFHEVADEYGLSDLICPDVSLDLHRRVNSGQDVLLEGAQGSGLSLIHGEWPYVTSHDTNASQLAADVGLAPSRITNVLLVARTYPIRVAGNSGPLIGETDWHSISNRMGKEVEEKTTVTKKVRRIGYWDPELFRRSMMLNQPTSVAVTFWDYMHPKEEGKDKFHKLSEESLEGISRFESLYQTRISLLGTGGPTCSVIDLGEI